MATQPPDKPDRIDPQAPSERPVPLPDETDTPEYPEVEPVEPGVETPTVYPFEWPGEEVPPGNDSVNN